MPCRDGHSVYFNPRSHERSDDSQFVYIAQMDISIHAPTRGATITARLLWITQQEFQSTLPREERPNRASSTRAAANFNPRSHERSDHARMRKRRSTGISIHAPTRGATMCPAIRFSRSVFQSTLPREERPFGEVVGDSHVDISIHAPTRGATETSVIFDTGTKISIHAPTRGATHDRHVTLWDLGISIHAPTRGATNGTH